MKLSELDPSWAVTGDNRHGMGITFLCPCCQNQYLAVWFANPIDDKPPAEPEIGPKPRWKRDGDSFDTLTLSPSIDASSSGHWHGWIRNGEIA